MKPGTHHTAAAKRAISKRLTGRSRGPDSEDKRDAKRASQQARRAAEVARGFRRWGGRVVPC